MYSVVHRASLAGQKNQTVLPLYRIGVSARCPAVYCGKLSAFTGEPQRSGLWAWTGEILHFLIERGQNQPAAWILIWTIYIRGK